MSQMAGGVRPEGDESCRKHSSWGDPGDWRAGISHVWTALQTKAVSVMFKDKKSPKLCLPLEAGTFSQDELVSKLQDLLQSTEHGNDGVEWHVVWVDGAASFTLRSKIESGGSTCGGGITGFRLQPTEALCSLLGLTPAEDGWITTTNAVHDQEGVIVSMSTLPGVHRESIEASRPAAAEGSRRDSGPSSTSLDVAHGLPGNVISKENGALGSEGHHTAFSAASGAVVSSTTALQGGGADRGATAIAAAMIRDGEGGRSQGGSWRWGIRGGTGVGGASHEREEASPPPGASVKNKNSDWKSSHVIRELGDAALHIRHRNLLAFPEASFGMPIQAVSRRECSKSGGTMVVPRAVVNMFETIENLLEVEGDSRRYTPYHTWLCPSEEMQGEVLRYAALLDEQPATPLSAHGENLHLMGNIVSTIVIRAESESEQSLTPVLQLALLRHYLSSLPESLFPHTFFAALLMAAEGAEEGMGEELRRVVAGASFECLGVSVAIRLLRLLARMAGRESGGMNGGGWEILSRGFALAVMRPKENVEAIIIALPRICTTVRLLMRHAGALTAELEPE